MLHQRKEIVMVSRDTRRALALTGNRHYRSSRIAIRRSAMPDGGVPGESVDPDGSGERSEGAEPTTARHVRTGRRRHRRITARPARQRLTVWAAIVVIVCALTAAAVQGRQWDQQRQLETARQQALAAARQTTDNFVTISAASVDRDLQRVADGATGDFKDEFARSMPQVRAAVVENKVNSQGTVLRAAVVSADRTSAVVLVALDATVRNVNAPDGRLAHYRIRVNLGLVGNAWLVSTLEFVG
jgi:Mce-associated membrane protein